MVGPQKGTGRQGKSGNKLKKFYRGCLNFIWQFSYHFVRKSLCLVIAIVFIVGCFSFYDIVCGDGTVRDPNILGQRSPARELAKINTTKDIEMPLDEGEYWEHIQPTLKVLRAVSPQAEKWVREKQETGKIKYDASTGFYATFDFVSRELTIYPRFFDMEDGVKASILAHEWRHSRQNPEKFIKYIMSYAITRELQTELVENDAYLYEAQCRESLYGY